jgi:hypothetical protein
LLTSWLARGLLRGGCGNQFECEARGGLGWSDRQKANGGARRDFLELSVELGIEKFGSAHHAAGFRDVHGGIAQVEAIDESIGEDCDFLRGVAEQSLCVSVAGFGGLRDDWKNARKNFVGSGAGSVAEIGPIRKFEVAENFCADGGVGAGAIAVTDGGGDSEATNIESAALVAEERAVAACAGGLALGVAAEGTGARAGDEDDRFGLSDGCEREFEIGDEADLRVGERVCEVVPHFFVGLRAADSSEAGADCGNLAEVDAGFAGGGLSGFGEGGSCGFVADAEWIRRAGAGGSADLVVGVEEDAFRFGATAVEAQDIVHEIEDMRFWAIGENCLPGM